MRPAVTARFSVPLCALALVACESEPEVAPPPVQDERTAEGEVLGGTISDAMLPLDERQSQSPAAEEDEEADGDSE